ncbi:uncharacterized protein PG998_005992 [Apiospora kogelbergensis]|uniref:Uncharacterized protein n=1 Tax=Apiospora kogelbergensis TaxID=1337665 RepID=A0AAW0R3Z6_9PEZI
MPLKPVAVFQVSKQLYQEAYPVFMHSNTFLIMDPEKGRTWLTYEYHTLEGVKHLTFLQWLAIHYSEV